MKTIPSNTMGKKNKVLFLSLFILFLVLSFLSLGMGSVDIPIKEIAHILLGNEASQFSWGKIILEFRLPKLITAILTGAALSVSGLQMQTIFRNPLAGPYVLGISAGSSLGVALLVLGFGSVFTIGGASLLGNWSLIFVAWLGAGSILFLIFLVSLRVKSVMTILILGILLGSATSALVSILQYFSNEAMLKTFIIWTLGSLGNVTISQLQLLVPVIIAGLLMAIFSSKSLNVLLLGENYAKSMGLNIKRSRIIIFLSTSILAGSITAFCGPIGFIGIAVPHICRIIFKTADHKILIRASILLGAIIMILSDIISQLPGYQSVLPINSVTALIGIPVVFYLIVKNQRISIWS